MDAANALALVVVTAIVACGVGFVLGYEYHNSICKLQNGALSGTIERTAPMGDSENYFLVLKVDSDMDSTLWNLGNVVENYKALCAPNHMSAWGTPSPESIARVLEAMNFPVMKESDFR